MVETIETVQDDSVMVGLLEFGIIQVLSGVLVGPDTRQELAAKSPEAYKQLNYLEDEWDFIYMTRKQYNELRA